MCAALGDEKIVVRAPATSANLGSGFDTAGVALDWWDTLTIARGSGRAGDLAVTTIGEEAETIPAGRDNLLIAAMMRLGEKVGRELPAVDLQLDLGFPLGRGFGSSATGIVLGLLAARELLAPGLPDTDIFDLATEVEGHPDNVAPCLFGSATLCWQEAGQPRHHQLRVHPDIVALALIAPQPMGTSTARKLLPEVIPFADAVWTAGRTALLPLALGGAFELLMPATDDVLHQNHRLAAWPDAAHALAELRAKGHAAFVSGAGPSLLVLCERHQLQRARLDAGAALHAADGWRLRDANIAHIGAARVDL